MKIDSFRGEYRFLSNFYDSKIDYQGLTYLNAEAAFQSMKSEGKHLRKHFTNLNPSEAKRCGRGLALRKDWEEVKTKIMYEVVKAKFTQNEDLKEKLLATGTAKLEEGNTWGDRIWGTVDGKGENRLGHILMKIRAELKNNVNSNLQ